MNSEFNFKSIIQFLDRVKWFGLRRLYWDMYRLWQWSSRYFLTFFSARITHRRLAQRIMHIFDGDEGQNVNVKNGFLGYGLIHYALVTNIRPKRILCIGSRQGYIPAILALSCRDTHSGVVDFVDAGYGSETPNKHWSGIGFWREVNAKRHFSQLNVEGYIYTYVMTTEEFKHIYPDREYDYIYIDGDHSYEGVAKDYALFWPALRSGGFMVFHDVVARGKIGTGEFGIWKWWQE